MAMNWTTGSDWTYDYSAPRTADGSPAKVALPTYDGAVLGLTSKTVQLMSDVWATGFFAEVWDGTRVKLVGYGNDEFGSNAKPVVDATDDVKALAAAYRKAQADAAAKLERQRAVDRQVEIAKTVAKGKDVTVVKGRKVPIGTTGNVFWLGQTQYGWRVGLKDANGTTHWTALSNVAVTNPDEYLDVDALMKMAA